MVRGIDVRGARFGKSLRKVADSFISSQREDGRIVVSPINPSLVDLLKRQITRSAHDIRAAFDGAAFFEQVIWLFDALGTGARRSPELAECVSDALEQTFDALPLEPRRARSIEERAHGKALERTVDRLDAVLSRFETSPALQAAAMHWLPERAAAWLEAARGFELEYALQVGPIHGLVAINALDSAAVAHRVIAWLPRRAFDLNDYELLVDAYGLAPEIIRSELERLRHHFERFATDALYDRRELENEDDLYTLERVADRMGVKLDEKLVERVRDELLIEEAQENAAWERMNRIGHRTPHMARTMRHRRHVRPPRRR
jgi:hypothetical protein